MSALGRRKMRTAIGDALSFLWEFGIRIRIEIDRHQMTKGKNAAINVSTLKSAAAVMLESKAPCHQKWHLITAHKPNTCIRYLNSECMFGNCIGACACYILMYI